MTRETRVKVSIEGFNKSSGISIQIDKDGNEIITPALMPTISAKGFDKLTGEELLVPLLVSCCWHVNKRQRTI